MTARINAIILAGDRRASIQVRDDSKAFLELKDEPLFIHVVRALQQASHIDQIIVIGPADRLAEALAVSQIQNVQVVPQRDNMIENFKAGYVASLGLGDDVSFWDLKGTKYEAVPVLVAPCDVPLLMPGEVDEFVERSNMHEYDYSIGVTSEKVLAHYHPREGKPLAFAHLDYIEKMYEWRYQTRTANILRMFFSLLFAGWRMLKGLRIFILMQLSLHYDRHGHPRLSGRIRSLVHFNRLAEGIGNALGARVQVVYTHFGGATLDVDNAEDLSVIEECYGEWMEYQRGLNP